MKPEVHKGHPSYCIWFSPRATHFRSDATVSFTSQYCSQHVAPYNSLSGLGGLARYIYHAFPYSLGGEAVLHTFPIHAAACRYTRRHVAYRFSPLGHMPPMEQFNCR